VITIADIHFTA